VTEPTTDERAAHYRQSFARQHLNRKSLDVGAVENTLRDLAAHSRSVAFLETEPARRDELAAVADALEDVIDTIRALSSRAWAATQSGWAPRGDDEDGN
jgi:hypothetical protein